MDISAVRQLLTSLQFTDSAFPSGFYTMSHGLEGYRQADLVGPGEVEGLLSDLLIHSVGPADATALAAAHRATCRADWDEVQRIDQLLYAAKLNAELRTASTRSGRQLADLVAELPDGARIGEYRDRIRARSAPGCQPVVTGVSYAITGVDVGSAVVSDLFAFSASFVAAGLRLRLTDHRTAQHILRRLAGVIEAVASDALARDPEDLGGCVPMADIMSARHEHAEARLFAS